MERKGFGHQMDGALWVRRRKDRPKPKVIAVQDEGAGSVVSRGSLYKRVSFSYNSRLETGIGIVRYAVEVE